MFHLFQEGVDTTIIKKKGREVKHNSREWTDEMFVVF